MDRLGINAGYLIANIINFALVATVLWLLVWRPMVRALEARRERISKGLEDARQAEMKLANAERDAQRLGDQRRAEANKVLEDARVNAEAQTKALLDEARREAEAIRTRARQEAIEERNAILDGVRGQVAQIAVAAAERVIGRTLDDAHKAHDMVDEFFTSVPEGANRLGSSIEVVSALPLTTEERARIEQATGTGGNRYSVDPAILGGLILRSEDKVIDGSVRNRLNSLASRMV